MNLSKLSEMIDGYVPCKWLATRPNTRCASCGSEAYCTKPKGKWRGKRTDAMMCQQNTEHPNRCNLDYELKLYEKEKKRYQAEGKTEVNYSIERIKMRLQNE